MLWVYVPVVIDDELALRSVCGRMVWSGSVVSCVPCGGESGTRQQGVRRGGASWSGPVQLTALLAVSAELWPWSWELRCHLGPVLRSAGGCVLHGSDRVTPSRC